MDPAWWGRLVENAVGAHLVNHLPAPEWGVTYWRQGNAEVDYVVERGRTLWGLEVKSGRPRPTPGLAAFRLAYRKAHTLIIGSDGIPLEEFLGSDPRPQLEGAA
jgi:predicted AAA+ superfamily ATPase